MTHTVRFSRFAVLIVAKAPVPGHAKTRLCPPAQGDEAAEIAAASLLDTLDTVLATPGAEPVVALAGEMDRAKRSAELTETLERLPVFSQGEGDFATRLARALRRTAELRPELPVLLIGMDTPQVTSHLLTSAAASMSEHDIDGALGPATDGGWWILGLREPGYAPALDALAGTPMSLADTGERTLRSLKGTGLNLATMPEISDVDTMDDARAVAQEVPGSRFATAVQRVTSG